MTKASSKSAGKNANSGKRTLIEPNGDKRYVRRNEKARL